jgi:hydrogenase maturation protein HypF
MKTYHIHIEGIVQGVGFRPFVYKMAKKYNLKGWVNNSNDGVHIHINGTKDEADNFLNNLIGNLPVLAVVTKYNIEETSFVEYSYFKIIKSDSSVKPKLLLTPDVAMCSDCKKELYDKKNRRFKYPFITCTNCGPRFSIIEKLPYDRPNTTMKDFKMCDACLEEYNNPMERRHFSQTNSCPDCPVEMQLFEKSNITQKFLNIDYIIKQWKAGKIIAIKGIGGFLITCDATNSKAVNTLRQRKKRPFKPFAMMYPNIESVEKDVFLNEPEKKELKTTHSPIVLLRTKPQLFHNLAIKEINDNLSRLGIMLPYTPLYELLLNKFNKPVVATSANITDSSIIFEDSKAVEQLSGIADIILMNNRDIVIPQDDGVVQFSKKHLHKIVIRRSRGKAPVYINPKITVPDKTIFSTGSMLKSTFGLTNRGYVYISQYLGNTENYDSQVNYEKTFSHFEKLLSPKIDMVVVDKHPDYFATRFGKQIAKKYNAHIKEVQHHKAHFYSVLGENNLLNSKDKILGVIWDGTGLGDDGKIWGSEFFIYDNKTITRKYHLNEFDLILADKMVKEPRISALSIAKNIDKVKILLKHKFTDTEWKIYNKLLTKHDNLKSTSMGRFFDAVASILFNLDIHHYDSQASMKLENKAADYFYNNKTDLSESYLDSIPKFITDSILENIIHDIEANVDKAKIAAKFHITLVDYILKVSKELGINKIAFSGGVFQNALLVDMIKEFMNKNYELYFHKEFSPNDEGIPFGQLVAGGLL